MIFNRIQIKLWPFFHKQLISTQICPFSCHSHKLYGIIQRHNKRSQTFLLKCFFDSTALFAQRHHGCVQDILCLVVQAEDSAQGVYCGCQYLRSSSKRTSYPLGQTGLSGESVPAEEEAHLQVARYFVKQKGLILSSDCKNSRGGFQEKVYKVLCFLYNFYTIFFLISDMAVN